MIEHTCFPSFVDCDGKVFCVHCGKLLIEPDQQKEIEIKKCNQKGDSENE